MGSLTSRPALPATQQPVIITMPSAPAPVATVTPPAYTSPPASSGTGSQPPATDTGGDSAVPSEEAVAKAREQSLLGRARGRISTVLTGFNGVLSQTVNGSGRKTLLGE